MLVKFYKFDAKSESYKISVTNCKTIQAVNNGMIKLLVLTDYDDENEIIKTSQLINITEG